MSVRLYIIVVLFLVCLTKLNSQTNGYYSFPEKGGSYVSNTYLENDKRFLVFAKTYNSGTTPQICQLNSENNLKQCFALNSSSYSEVVKVGDKYLLPSIYYAKVDDVDSVYLELRSSKLELIHSKSFKVGKETFRSFTLISDSIRIFVTSTNNKTDGLHEFVLSKDMDLDNTKHRVHYPEGGIIFSIAETKEHDGYVLATTLGPRIMDKEFKTTKVADTVLNVYANMVVNAIDEGYVCFGIVATNIGQSYRALGITKMDNELKYTKGDIFGYDEIGYPAILIPIAYNDENYYVTGMLDAFANSPNGGTEPNYFYIGKYDTDINRVWLKKKGGERHYALYGITADGNGGCCVYGFVREPGITDGKESQAIPFIMCFNDQGELTSYTTPQQPEERLFSIKGNPAYNSITLGNIYGQSGYTYSLYDTNGHKVSAGVLNTDDTVLDVSKLSAGMYLLSIQNKDAKVVQVEKLVKQ